MRSDGGMSRISTASEGGSSKNSKFHLNSSVLVTKQGKNLCIQGGISYSVRLKLSMFTSFRSFEKVQLADAGSVDEVL